MPVSALEALAGYWSRVLGAVRSAGRVSYPLPGLSSSLRSHPDIVSDVSVRISSVTGSGPGDREDVNQGCLGDHPRSGTRLLHSSFSYGKGDGRLASRDRPLSPEQVYSTNSVQGGDRSLRAALRPEGGFTGFHRPEDAYFQIPVHQSSRKLLRFLLGGMVYQLKVSVLQTIGCPSGLHQGVCNGLCVGSLQRDSSSQVPGRLAGPRLFVGGGQKEHPGSAHALSLPRDSDKREVRSCPLADCKLLQYDHRYGAAMIFPALARVEKFGSAGEVGSSQSSSNALPAVAFEDALVSRVGYCLAPGAPVSGGEGGSVLVDGAVPFS